MTFVVICFHFSIFEPLETSFNEIRCLDEALLICFQISIFDPLETSQSVLYAVYQLDDRMVRK